MTTPLDKLAEAIAEMSSAPWRSETTTVWDIEHLVCRASPKEDYAHGMTHCLHNAAGIVALRNAAAELIEVARAAQHVIGFAVLEGSPTYRLHQALAALEVKLGGEGKTFKSKAPIWEPEY